MPKKQSKLSEEKKTEIASYLSTLRIMEQTNRSDIDQNIDEYWSRHFGIFSCKKNKDFPWKGSADIKTGVIQYSDSAIEARYCNALNTLNFCSIVSKVSKASEEAAKSVENYFNNYWFHKTKAKKVLLDGFQYLVVEGTMFIKIVPKKLSKKVKRFTFKEIVVNLKDKAIQYMTGQDGKMQTEEKDRDEFLGAVWENVPTRKMFFESSESGLGSCGWAMNEFDLSPNELYDKKEQGWYNLGKILNKGQANQQPKIKTGSGQDKEQSEQTKNDYQGFNNTLTEKETFYEFWKVYNVGTAEAPDYKALMLVQSALTGDLVYDEENAFFDKRKPYVSAPCWRVAGRIIGQGMPQRLAALNDSVDTLFNQALDNNTLSNTITGTIIQQPGMDIDKMSMQPGRFIPVKSHDNIKQFQFTNRLGDIQVLMQTLMSLIERKSIVSDYTLGRESNQNKTPTARGTAMLLQQYALNLDLLMQNVQECLKEALYQTMQSLYEFMPNEGITYSFQDPQTQEYKEGVLKREQLEFMDDWDIAIMQGAVDIMVSAEKNAAMTLLQAFGPDQTGEVDTFFLKRWFAEVMAPRQAKEIMRQPKEVQQIQMIKQKAQEVAQKEQLVNQRAQQLDQQLQQHQQKIVGESAQLEEAKFMHAMERQNVPPEQAVQLLAEFRQKYAAREKAKQMGIDPEAVVPTAPPAQQPEAQQ